MLQPEEQIPEQQTGSESNTEAQQNFDTEAEAAHFYETVKQRFLAVNRWHEWAGPGTAEFWLTDAAGNEVQREPLAGDHFKIDIPGPGTQTGDGFDWVRIEAVETVHEPHSDCMLIRVRPATNPNNEKQDVAHFFSEEATSNFVVKREGATVSAAVHGRNEKPNVEAEAVVDKLRNSAVATGAVAAFSKLQWKALVSGMVKR
ncbi:hypothetical protein SAMN05444008_10821 [Cnuella takakiae]|uniref:Activator of Hsp90 ATPase homolog 1-like protein n=1 Tax=Cnuella takakiae TaxID=1302690 RepID=A0A1M5BNJ0_9BACT|nr:hypothetical protein [Cnuella takakiae]OLY93455.1 hypothetical protein BUE76_17370 [Cnuella takakiae]SHF44099.1 hypothetical protein SAMN05444008_10821 [Cnuella takakiae]